MKELMKDEEHLIGLLRQAATLWLAMGHQDIWDSDDFTDDLGHFCNRVANTLASEPLPHVDRVKLWGIFAPTCAWDDSVGDSELGSRIFTLIETLYRQEVFASD